METVGNNKRIAKNTLYVYIRMLIIVIVNLYASRIILNVLGIVDYGIYNIVGGTVVLFSFLNQALSSATQRFVAYEMGCGNATKLHETFCMCFNVHVIIAVFIVIAAETLGLWLVCNKLVIPENRYETALLVYQCSIISSVVSIIQVPFNATVNAHEKFNVYAIISISKADCCLPCLLSI